MNRTVVSLAVGLVAAMTVFVGSAQSEPWRLVQASDRSLHVLTGGARHRIVPAPVTDAELAAIPEAESWLEGQPVGTVANVPQPPTAQAQKHIVEVPGVVLLVDVVTGETWVIRSYPYMVGGNLITPSPQPRSASRSAGPARHVVKVPGEVLLVDPDTGEAERVYCYPVIQSGNIITPAGCNAWVGDR